jgi:hypothetical protein
LKAQIKGSIGHLLHDILILKHLFCKRICIWKLPGASKKKELPPFEKKIRKTSPTEQKEATRS